MLLEDKFLYTRILETDGRVGKELTFAGAVLVVFGALIVAVAAALIIFPFLTNLGVRV